MNGGRKEGLALDATTDVLHPTVGLKGGAHVKEKEWVASNKYERLRSSDDRVKYVFITYALETVDRSTMAVSGLSLIHI